MLWSLVDTDYSIHPILQLYHNQFPMMHTIAGNVVNIVIWHASPQNHHLQPGLYQSKCYLNSHHIAMVVI